MKYRKKPVVVEATQWWPGVEIAGVHTGIGVPYIVTIHGQRADLAPGDWVIAEPDGIHHYPCKPDIFATIYEPAGESP